MHKLLLRLFLPLFILAVLNPGAYTLSSLKGGALTDGYQASIKKQVQASLLVKNQQAESTLAHPVYGFTKPLWTGDLNFYGYRFSETCRTIIVLNKRQVIHRQEFLQLLLFPFHFFS